MDHGLQPKEIAPQAIASAFELALAAAREFEGATAPNPPVGCCILDARGNVLALAQHRKAGGPHAEALAIAECRRSGRFAAIDTIIVTLEPCNHAGRTPPCSHAILQTPARRIVIGSPDRNPDVVGGGAAMLRSHGRQVDWIGQLDHPEADKLARSAERLIAPFMKRAETGLPWVCVKQAFDAGGDMIPPPGRKTFTSPAALDLAHRLRRRADAIITGSGTVLADTPLFTVRRVPDFEGKTRRLVILDRRGRVPQSYVEASRQNGFDVEVAASLPDAISTLGRQGTMEILIEAGPALSNAVLHSDLWDEHVAIRVNADGSEDVQIRTRLPIQPAQSER